ncbi:MAG: 16S rRNA (uracil(1498)-N(3))-methyltransferase [Betaproteobacteria bacterium]
MAHPRFHVSQPLPRAPAADALYDVSEEIARHFQVLRIGVNDNVALFDGLGGEWIAVIAVMGKRQATVRMTQFVPIERESSLMLTLVQALATSDKMDLIVQKAVELGIAGIQPIATERATLKLAGDRAQKRAAHWQAIARAACEQCGRNRVPAVADVISLEAWLALPAAGTQVMLQPAATISLVGSADLTQPLAVLVGPEGGFSDNEFAMAVRHGIKPVSLGPRVLRTETAGLAAIAALNAVHGDLR